MTFTLFPLLDRMEEFYLLPRNRQRFETYLEMMLGPDREDIVLPIASFNPMGRDLVLGKIRELRAINAEGVAAVAIDAVNTALEEMSGPTIHLALNLVDDVGGSWSNRYTTDYTSKFDFGGTFKRNFCLPYFWTSESYTKDSIRRRCLEYLYRSVSWLKVGKPETLGQHLEQEIFVQKHLQQHHGFSTNTSMSAEVDALAQTHFEDTNYSFIFNFFYGDSACKGLNYPTNGIKEQAGFQYVSAWVAQSKA